MQEQLLAHQVEEGNKAVRNATLHAKEAQESGNENFLHFVDRLVLISGGALSASFTIFLALREKQGVEGAAPAFLFVWVALLLAIACGLSLRIFLAYSHFVQAAIFMGNAFVIEKETVLKSKGRLIDSTTGNAFSDADFEAVSNSLEETRPLLNKRQRERDFFVNLYKGVFWGSLLSFFSGIVGLVVIGFLIVYPS